MKINLSIQDIAKIINGKIEGNQNLNFVGINGIEDALEGDLSFYYNAKYEKYLSTTSASCLIVGNDFNSNELPNLNFIKVENPNEAIFKLLNYIDSQKRNVDIKIHPKAIIGNKCSISESANICAGVVVGDGCKIGNNVIIYPNSVIYDNVEIDDNTIIHANVTIHNDVIIGKNCILMSSCVIGSDGFGYLEDKNDKSLLKIPQLGNVILEDNVEIGANTTIDRALVGSTIIHKGTKIDNLVQIAHNCNIGENTGIASQAGISGSVTIGKRNRIAGQVGIAGHLEITDDVTILAQSGVPKSIDTPGSYFGSPIKQQLKAFKIEAAIQNLPDMVKEIYHIKKMINETQLENK